MEEQFKEILDEHGVRITKLESDQAIIRGDISNIKLQMEDVKELVTRFESNYLQSTNTILGVMSQIVLNTSNNSTEMVKTQANNRTQIIIKVLSIFGAILAGWFMAKYGISISL